MMNPSGEQLAAVQALVAGAVPLAVMMISWRRAPHTAATLLHDATTAAPGPRQ
jgi:hypothetical protein